MINRNIWPKKFSHKAITIAFAVIFILNALFINYYTPFFLLLLIFGVTIFFFQSLHRYTVKWEKYSKKIFFRELFLHSIFYRLIFVGILYLTTWIYDPASLPFEMFAADSWSYYKIGGNLTNNIFNGNYIGILSRFWKDQADWGFSIYLGLINTILFNSVLLVKLINVVLGSLTVVLLAKMATRLYSFDHGRMTGIIAMLMPSLMWADAKYLKETLMIFIIVMIFFNAVKMVTTGRILFGSIVVIFIGSILLFYFRTVIAVIVILSLILYFLLNFATSKRNKMIPFILSFAFIAGIYMFSLQFSQVAEIENQFSQLGDASESRISSKIKKVGTIDLKTQLAIPLVMVNSFISPYPSFLNLDIRQVGVISHAQNEVIRIIIYYFALIGIVLLIKRDFANSSLILSFTIGYILILAVTGTSYSDRFHLPAVPFMIILISVGFIDSSKKWFLNWNKYLLIIWGAVILWHLFKMGIRGM